MMSWQRMREKQAAILQRSLNTKETVNGLFVSPNTTTTGKHPLFKKKKGERNLKSGLAEWMDVRKVNRSHRLI